MIKTFLYYLKIYIKISSQDIKSKMHYRTDFFISTLGILMTNISGLIAFWVLFQNINSIIGWKYYELVFMYGFSLLALTPMQLFFDNIWNLSNNVFSGNFIKYCFRPIDMFFYYMVEVFDIKGIAQLIMGIIMIGYSLTKLNVEINFFKILLFLLLLLSSSLVMISMMVIASSMAFYILNASSIMMFLFRFKEFSKYPIKIFNPVLRVIFTFLIPIAYISFYPSQLFLKPDNSIGLAILSPIIGILFFIIAYKVWSYGAKSYSGTGS